MTEIDETFDDIRDYVKMTDGTVETEIGPEIRDGKEIRGLRVGRAGYHYDVLGSPDADYFLLRFGFNLLENLRNSGVDSPAAALASQEDADMKRLVFDLMREISHPSVEVGVETTDDGVLAAFTVERKLFVHEDDFGVRDFEEAVRAVVARATAASNTSSLRLKSEANPKPEKRNVTGASGSRPPLPSLSFTQSS